MIILPYLHAVTCAFVCLAYSELASFLPVSGSSYTYAYASLGEIFGWWVGWSLILEYSVGAKRRCWRLVGLFRRNPAFHGHRPSQALTAVPADGGIINLPAVLIVALATALLVVGVRESARVNRVLVYVKIGTIFLFLFLAGPHIEPMNWEPSCRTASMASSPGPPSCSLLTSASTPVDSGRRKRRTRNGICRSASSRSGYLYGALHRRLRRYDRRRPVSHARYGSTGVLRPGIHRPPSRFGHRRYGRYLRPVDGRPGHALRSEPGSLLDEP